MKKKFHRQFVNTSVFCVRVVTLLSQIVSQFFGAATTPVLAAGILYATPDATGAGDCSNWTNACTLQTAITTAVSGDEIWVAAGTHNPTTGTDRWATFHLKDGVTVYGGFAGMETARNERNPATNVTTLSGDLNGDDVGFTNNSENVYNVVIGANNATLDGFTITAGNADIGNGGGMVNNGRSPTLINLIFTGNHALLGAGMMNKNNSNPELTNVTFSGNIAEDGGGGMDNNNQSSPTLTNVTFTSNTVNETNGGGGGGMENQNNSNPTLTNVTFSGNSSADSGGGMFNYSGSSLTLANVTFSNNTAQYGGGLYDSSSNPTLTNVTFDGNMATGDAGPSGGGMFNDQSSPILTNVTFSNNNATGSDSDVDGGGMYNMRNSSPTLTNVTFGGNMASMNGGGMYNENSNPTLINVTFGGNAAPSGGGMYNDNTGSSLIHASIYNSIFWGEGSQIFNVSSAPVIIDSIVLGGCPNGGTCTNVMSADPFLQPLANNGGSTQTMALGSGSAAIDSGGVNSTCAAMDQRGVARPQPTGGACDIGAFEQIINKRIVVKTNDNWIRARDWPEGTSLTLTIDDPADGTGDVDYTTSKTAELGSPDSGWGPLETYADFNLNGFDVKAGQILTVSGGGIVRVLTPTDLVVTEVDEDADTISGTTTSSLKVFVNVCDYTGNDCFYRNVMPDPDTHTWTVNFNSGVIDLFAGGNATVEQRDENGNITRDEWWIPKPNIEVHMPNQVQGQAWPDGDTVTIEIDNDGDGSPEITREAVVGPAPAEWNASYTNFSYNFAGEFNIQAGDLVTVTDGSLVMSMTVSAYPVTGFNTNTGVETVSGVSTPGADVQVCADQLSGGCINRYAVVDGTTGAWSVSFSGDVDLEPGSTGWTAEWDADRNGTRYNWTILNPRIEANPGDNWVHARDWPNRTELTLTIDDPDTGEGVDKTVVATVGPSSWDSNDIAAEFNLGGFDLQPGDKLFVTDGATEPTERTYYPTSLAVTDIDLDADTISGIATPGVGVGVCANYPSCVRRSVTSDAVTGSWTADYDGSDGVNLVPGMDGWAVENDDNGNGTFASWRIPNPHIWAGRTDHWVQALDWPNGSLLTLTIGGESTTYQATVQSGAANFFLMGFDLQAGHVLTVTDNGSPAIERTYTVTDLAVTGFNLAADTISGTGTSSDEVQVCVGTPGNCVKRFVTPVANSWTVDYRGTGGVDLVPGTDGYAAQRDTNGNQTFVFWGIPTVEITSDSPDPSEIGQSVTVNVTVTGTSLPVPTGVVHITGTDGDCDITLAGGAGSCVVVFNTDGMKTITATYDGDSKNLRNAPMKYIQCQQHPTLLEQREAT